MALPTSQQHQPAPPTSASPAAVRKSTMPNPIRIAIKDFRTGVDGDLAFSVGDMIEVIAEGALRIDENWMSGTLNGRTGIFPTNFTEPRVAKPIIPSMSPKPPPAIAASVTPSASMLPPQPPALSSKPSGKLSAANTSRTPHTPLPLHQQATASIISTASSIPQPQPPTTTATDLQFFYLRSKANGNVLGVEMGLTSMVTHDSPVLVVPLTAKNTEPLMLRRDESGCLITPSNLALDVRFGEWVNGGTVVLAKRVPPANVPEGAFHQRWEITGDGSVRSVDRNFQLVEDYGRAIIWESDVDLEDQRWDMVPLM
ncbi:hypothetical protein HDU83_002915 [Entophlyctis luteolus]|nr:hypothetical protein HDU83_002915 [Entophlyctis luteolus]